MKVKEDFSIIEAVIIFHNGPGGDDLVLPPSTVGDLPVTHSRGIVWGSI
jgi:hypothetical protein